MEPKPQPRDSFERLQAHFEQMLDPSHEPIQLARMIDCAHLDAAFVDCYRTDIGAPAKAIRLMVGLHYLKYAYDESDESVVDRWVDNPYWQYFCGYTHCTSGSLHQQGQSQQALRVRAKGCRGHNESQ